MPTYRVRPVVPAPPVENLSWTPEERQAMGLALAQDLVTASDAPLVGSVPTSLEEKLGYSYQEIATFIKELVTNPMELNDGFTRFKYAFPRCPITLTEFGNLATDLTTAGVLEERN